MTVRVLLASIALVSGVLLAACDWPRDYECKAVWRNGHEITELKAMRLKEMRAHQYALDICERRSKTHEPAGLWTSFECTCSLPSG